MLPISGPCYRPGLVLDRRRRLFAVVLDTRGSKRFSRCRVGISPRTWCAQHTLRAGARRVCYSLALSRYTKPAGLKQRSPRSVPARSDRHDSTDIYSVYRALNRRRGWLQILPLTRVSTIRCSVRVVQTCTHTPAPSRTRSRSRVVPSAVMALRRPLFPLTVLRILRQRLRHLSLLTGMRATPTVYPRISALAQGRAATDAAPDFDVRGCDSGSTLKSRVPIAVHMRRARLSSEALTLMLYARVRGRTSYARESSRAA